MIGADEVEIRGRWLDVGGELGKWYRLPVQFVCPEPALPKLSLGKPITLCSAESWPTEQASQSRTFPMTGPPNFCDAALANVRSSIRPDRRLPHSVFYDSWNEFFFFDSDWVFDREFVSLAQALLDIEGASCACVLNLDAAAYQPDMLEHIFINGQTTPEQYRSLVVGDTPVDPSAWTNNVGRCGCSSDRGHWSIYLERAAEIAIIAIRDDISVERYRSVLTQLYGIRVDEAIENPHIYAFIGMVPEWRDELRQNYGGTGRTIVPDRYARDRARDIARKALAGDYDILLACRELADLNKRLSNLNDDVMITFIAVASELDDLPIGAERQYWAPNALRAHDVRAAGFREQVRREATEALQKLLTALGNDDAV